MVEKDRPFNVDNNRQLQPDRQGFGTLLTSLRRHHGLLQKDVAANLGVDGSTISQWERGNRAPRQRDMVEKIIEVFGANPIEAAQLFRASGFKTAEFSSTEEVVLELNSLFADPEVQDDLKDQFAVLLIDSIKLFRMLARINK